MGLPAESLGELLYLALDSVDLQTVVEAARAEPCQESTRKGRQNRTQGRRKHECACAITVSIPAHSNLSRALLVSTAVA